MGIVFVTLPFWTIYQPIQCEKQMIEAQKQKIPSWSCNATTPVLKRYS